MALYLAILMLIKVIGSNNNISNQWSAPTWSTGNILKSVTVKVEKPSSFKYYYKLDNIKICFLPKYSNQVLQNLPEQ